MEWKKYPKIYRDTLEVFDEPIVIEEKLDGANVGIHWDGIQFHLQGRRRWTKHKPHRQYRHFENWAWENLDKIQKIPIGWVIHGEYMYAKHAIPYNQLPDWFVCFDIWTGKDFLPDETKREFCEKTGLAVTPKLYQGKTNLEKAKKFITTSKFGTEQMEGIVIKTHKNEKILKYTTQEFQKILEDDEHWLKKPVTPNKLNARVPKRLTERV